MTRHAKYLLFLLPIVGVAIFVAGVLYRRKLKAQVEGFNRTTGAVVDNIAGAEGFAAVVEYFAGGKPFTVTSTVERNPRRKKGHPSAVMYDPANPVRAVIVEDYYILANMLLVIGGVFALAGFLAAYYLRAAG